VETPPPEDLLNAPAIVSVKPCSQDLTAAAAGRVVVAPLAGVAGAVAGLAQ
jgi:hypothetical protein